MKLTPDVVVGLIIVFGIAQVAILLMLKKLGAISFGEKNVCPDHCPEHDFFCKELKKMKDKVEAMRDQQTERYPLLKAHGKQLNEGKTMFEALRKDISLIKTDLALILQKMDTLTNEKP